MRNMIRKFLLGVMVAVVVAGCSSTPTGPTINVPFATADLRVGVGTEAAAGRVVSVNYTGWLYNPAGVDNKGTQFDTSIGRTPFSFTVGTGVIPGFSQGLVGMKVGGLRRVTIPPALGYGAQGSPPTIPANATLIFEIELLSVQ